MRQKSGMQIVTVAVFAVVAALFVLFAIYMCFFESNTIYSARDSLSYKTVVGYSEKEVADPSAPLGLRKEYTWTMEDISPGGSYLAFYLVHHYAEVWFDDELMYSLEPGAGNRVGNSPSSNWVMIPVYPSDRGRAVRITVTPVFQSVVNRNTEFLIGSRYAIVMARLKADLPQLVLSALCIIMGLLLMGIQPYFVFRKKTLSWDIFYLGFFAFLIGLWRITDTRFSPLMFGKNPMALGYITLGALFLAGIPFLLFIREQCSEKGRLILLIPALLSCFGALAALICQVFGWAELREILLLSHVMIVMDLAASVVTLLFFRRKKTDIWDSYLLLLLLVVGTLSDLFNFYLKGSSSGILFTIIALLIYTFFRLFKTIFVIRKSAYIDEHTGLQNKRRWDEEISNDAPFTKPTGIIMMDLNRLKYINDTMGHESGDKLLSAFADILGNTFSNNELVCRWGGDEFAVLVTSADREKVEQYLSSLLTATKAYNDSGASPELYFASGYALSSDFPDFSRQQLFEKADELMYQDKQRWYKEHPAIS